VCSCLVRKPTCLSNAPSEGRIRVDAAILQICQPAGMIRDGLRLCVRPQPLSEHRIYPGNRNLVGLDLFLRRSMRGLWFDPEGPWCAKSSTSSPQCLAVFYASSLIRFSGEEESGDRGSCLDVHRQFTQMGVIPNKANRPSSSSKSNRSTYSKCATNPSDRLPLSSCFQNTRRHGTGHLKGMTDSALDLRSGFWSIARP